MKYLAGINFLTDLDDKVKTIMHYLPVPLAIVVVALPKKC